MYEIETALLYFQDGTKQFTDQRDTSLCVTFVGMFLLREALNTLLRNRITDKQHLKEIKDILFFRSGKLSLPQTESHSGTWRDLPLQQYRQVNVQCMTYSI